MTALLDLSAAELLDRFGSPDPTPGGGSAAALSGALGSSLVAMVCGMPKTRTGAPGERARLDSALAWAREAGSRLRALVQDDARAYDAVVAAYRLPKGTDGEKAARKAAIASAMVRATDVPIETAEACLVVLKAAQEAAAHGNPNALSDARTGGALGWAGLVGAAENVRINAASQADAGSAALERVEAAVREGRSRVAVLGLV
ncbi:MAG TPA: cyclodeaminase/cyclohydrolase family protein [Vicinamibacteria bacterium]|nr:cyclodeaminase/cyclohydrolase family protein [Vicinamibacteria bacterium]